MKALKTLVKLVRDRSGATAIEYALIAGIICLAIVAGATTLGQSANDSFTNVQDQVWGS
jgi:pilus assembly protein Flp/PilA